MSHTDKVACEITDPDGNHFQVSFFDRKIVSLCCCAGLFKVVNTEGMWEFGSMKQFAIFLKSQRKTYDGKKYRNSLNVYYLTC